MISISFSVRWLWICKYNIYCHCHFSEICWWQVESVMSSLYSTVTGQFADKSTLVVSQVADWSTCRSIIDRVRL